MDNNKENVAEQKSQRELSDASTVKTPLVDALRRYFVKFEDGFQNTEVALFSNQS